MKKKLVFIFGMLLLISFSVTAQQEISVAEYNEEIQDLINQYGKDFDDCLPELASDFPTLPDDYLEIDEKIEELSNLKWYHRKIPFFGTQIDEIVISIKHDMSHYLIRVTYLFNEEESSFIIYSVNFFDNIQGSVEGDFWNAMTIPSGISQDSLKEIDICEETPGFMIIPCLLALTIALFIYYNKSKN